MSDTPPAPSVASKKKASRLGRGLSSLMASPMSVAQPAEASSVSVTQAEDVPRGTAEPVGADETRPEGLRMLPVGSVVPNPNQPRQRFEESALKELAGSIKAEGMIQPIVVRPSGEGRYELVAGERRWRAAQLAGLEEIPSLVRELDDAKSAEWALIENLQREDLNPIERAEAFQKLGQSFGLSHEQVAERVGLERSTVTNLLRLLRLTPAVREMVSRGTLSMGQSRALAGLEDGAQQQVLAERAVQEGWSVRQVEAAVRQAQSAVAAPAEPPKKVVRAAYLDDLEKQIGEQLSTKVKIKTARKKGAGTLSIEFYNIDQFDELLGKLGVSTQ